MPEAEYKLNQKVSKILTGNPKENRLLMPTSAYKLDAATKADEMGVRPIGKFSEHKTSKTKDSKVPGPSKPKPQVSSPKDEPNASTKPAATTKNTTKSKGPRANKSEPSTKINWREITEKRILHEPKHLYTHKMNARKNWRRAFISEFEFEN